jgi:soluble lytic murein transglycosylase-like protein
MARLIGFGLAAALLWAAPASADTVNRWQPYISEASLRFGIPEDWIVRVMRAESGGQTQRNGKPIRSRVGAMGLMQIMPGTWAGLTMRYALGSNPDDPRTNIFGGTAYLREMYDQFGYPGLFAAYNAGPARYAAYRGGRSRLPRETVAYVASITGSAAPTPLAPSAATAAVHNDGQLASATPPPTLFFRVKSEPHSVSGSPQVTAPSTLFVTLKTTQRGSE